MGGFAFVSDAATRLPDAAGGVGVSDGAEDTIVSSLMAFVIFLMVKAINQLHKLGKKNEEEEPEEEPAPTSEELLTEIRDLLKEQQK